VAPVSPEGSHISAVVAVVLENGQIEEDPPQGAPVPAVIAWIDPANARHYGPRVFIPAESREEWSVVVSVPSDTRVSVLLVAADADVP
jgi:hypothetical protein